MILTVTPVAGASLPVHQDSTVTILSLLFHPMWQGLGYVLLFPSTLCTGFCTEKMLNKSSVMANPSG